MNLETLFRSRIPGIANFSDNSQYVLAIPLIETDTETNILFEVRGAISQAGDVCLPGGHMEEGENPEDALRREMCEELLICDEQIEMIGPSDIFISEWGWIIRPYVVKLTGYRGTFSEDEVEEIFEMPLHYFLENDPKPYKISMKEEPEEDFPFDRISGGRNYGWHAGERNVYFYDYEEHTIWGLTARIMKRFGEIVRDVRKEEDCRDD